MDDTYSGRELVESKREIDGGISIIFWKDDLISMSMLLNTLINHAKMKPFLKLNSSKYYPIEGIKLVAHELKKQESVFFGRAHKKNALVFSGYKPLFNHSSYIEEVLQAAEYYGGSDLIVTVSGVPSQTSHRDARNQIYIFNSERYKQTFQEKYKTLKTKPFSTSSQINSDQPSFNSWLSWEAAKRGIPCVNILIETPFYMSITGDAEAELTGIKILNKILNWRIKADPELTLLAERQAALMETIISNSEDATDFMEKMENNELLSMEEMQLMISELQRLLTGE